MADDSTYIVYTSTQPDTPQYYSNYITEGPSNAILNCQPSPQQSWYLTLWWYATGNGCPNGYSYVADGTASTCIYSSTIDTTITLTWDCCFTVSDSTTSVVDGGTTTFQDGEAATITGATQTTTVTETAQVTSWQVSIYDPGAVTVLVTSTLTIQQGAHKRRERSSPRSRINQDLSPYGSTYNASQLVFGELFKRQDNFECPGTTYYCEDGSACLGDTNPIICCAGTLICIPYDWQAVFAAIATDDPVFSTTTSLSTSYLTTYETANAPSSTVTVTESETETMTVTNVNILTTVATASDATVTAVQWVTSTVSATSTNSAGGAGVVVTLVSTQDGKKVTLISENGGVASTLDSSSTAIAAPGSSGGASTSTSTSTSSDIGIKVGLGVGIPIAVALFGLLFFLIFRHRQQQKASRGSGISGGGGPGIDHNDGMEAVAGERPMSNLPQYTPMAGGGAAGVGAGMDTPLVSEMKANELPRQTADEVDGVGLAEVRGGRTPAGRYSEVYRPDRDGGTWAENDVYRRYELPSPVHEMHELPGYYGA